MKKLNIILSLCLIICSIFAFASCSSNDIDSAKVTALMDKGETYIDQSLENESKLLNLLNNTETKSETLYGEDAINKAITLLINGTENEYKTATANFSRSGFSEVGLWVKTENVMTVSVYSDHHGNYQILESFNYNTFGPNGPGGEGRKIYIELVTDEDEFLYEEYIYQSETMEFTKVDIGDMDYSIRNYVEHYLTEYSTKNMILGYSGIKNFSAAMIKNLYEMNANFEDSNIFCYLEATSENEYKFVIHGVLGEDDEVVDFIFTVKNGLITRFVDQTYSDGGYYIVERDTIEFTYSNDDIAFDKTGYTETA